MSPAPSNNVAPVTDHHSDGSLLRIFQEGNESAATALYLRYARRLTALAQARTPADLARRIDAEDIVQSAFKSFFRRARQGCYDAPNGEELWGLLLVITLNKIRSQGNFHRAARRDVRITLPESANDEDARYSADEEAVKTLHLVIHDILEQHPETNRQVVLLRIEGYEVAEIAAKVGRSKRTVERVLQEFKAELSRDLGGDP